ELEISRIAGPVDGTEMSNRAEALIPERHGSGQDSLVLAIAAGPRQQVLRPSALEDEILSNALMKSALFGDTPLFSHEQGTKRDVNGHSLLIAQEHASILLDELGSVCITQPGTTRDNSRMGGMTALIEEDLRDRLQRAIRFSGWVLEQIDSTRRLS